MLGTFIGIECEIGVVILVAIALFLVLLLK